MNAIHKKYGVRSYRAVVMWWGLLSVSTVASSETISLNQVSMETTLVFSGMIGNT